MHAIVAELSELIESHGWESVFQEVLVNVANEIVPGLEGTDTLVGYLAYLDRMVRWTPQEEGDSHVVQDKLLEFFFVLGQPALRSLQTACTPGSGEQPITPLSRWVGGFAKAWGNYLDTPESASGVQSFRTNPKFRWNDYMPPPSGYLTFNQFFARHVKPGRRPVASSMDDQVLVSPVDGSFIGQWTIAENSTIKVDQKTVNAKGLRWSIAQLLRDSAYADRFAGGLFTHSALRTFDYHRFHTPVAGTVLETRIIQGKTSLDVEVVDADADEGKTKSRQRTLRAIEGTGFQFSQTRGLVVLKTALGLVACLPVGMAHVSSVVLTAEVGTTLRKGEELGYFQFGGSDFVMVFEKGSGISFECAEQQHFLQGEHMAKRQPRV